MKTRERRGKKVVWGPRDLFWKWGDCCFVVCLFFNFFFFFFCFIYSLSHIDQICWFLPVATIFAVREVTGRPEQSPTSANPRPSVALPTSAKQNIGGNRLVGEQKTQKPFKKFTFDFYNQVQGRRMNQWLYALYLVVIFAGSIPSILDPE